MVGVMSPRKSRKRKTMQGFEGYWGVLLWVKWESIRGLGGRGSQPFSFGLHMFVSGKQMDM